MLISLSLPGPRAEPGFRPTCLAERTKGKWFDYRKLLIDEVKLKFVLQTQKIYGTNWRKMSRLLDIYGY